MRNNRRKCETLTAEHLIRLQRAREMGWSLGAVLIPMFVIRFFRTLEFFGSVPTLLGFFLDWVNLIISVGLVWVGILCISEALKIGSALKNPEQLRTSKFSTRFLEGNHWVVVFPFYFRY